MDKAAVLFEPWVTRRWIYEPTYGVLMDDDAVEYTERIADLGYPSRPMADDGYLDWHAIYSGLEHLRGKYAKLYSGEVADKTTYYEEEGMAALLVRGRLARLFKGGGTLVVHNRILAWVVGVIHDRKSFDASFQAELDAKLRAGYPGLPPRT